MSTGCNRRGPQISGTPPTIECESINWNTVSYQIENAAYAYWTRSSLPSARNRIPLIGGSATDTLEVDSTDTYKICAEACGGCGRVCCEFECDTGFSTDGSCECVDENTLIKSDITFFEVKIETSSPGTFTPEFPYASCSPVDCVDVDGTHIIPCAIDYYLINHVFLCTINIDAANRDAYIYMHAERLTGSAGDMGLSIEHGIVAYTPGTVPPTDVKPETVSGFMAINRYWRRFYRFDLPNITETNPCNGASVSLQVCSVGTGETTIIRILGDNFGGSESRGCPKPVVTVESLGLT